MVGSGYSFCSENTTCQNSLCSQLSLVRWNYVLELFFWFGLIPLVPIHNKLKASVYWTISNDIVLPILGLIYGLYPCYFQVDNVSYHIERSTMDWYVDNGVNRIDWSA
ncbi:hypothetical protein TNCT_63861 [Trichonephila clavata]|uniref:Uncharacterized protein n=1 Tax=Trichonephila clavata TaxID=2740835 RepID=A0A8X6FW05_TRICU|nr:hypothetical protein TNCT_63861 [Trichonephila clavata]